MSSKKTREEDVKKCKKLKVNFLKIFCKCDEKTMTKFMVETMPTVYQALVRKETDTEESKHIWSLFFSRRAKKVIELFMSYDLGRFLFFNNVRNMIYIITPRLMFYYKELKKYENMKFNVTTMDLIMNIMFHFSKKEVASSLKWINIFAPLLEKYDILSKKEQNFFFNSIFYKSGDILPLVKIKKNIVRTKKEVNNGVFLENILNFFEKSGHTLIIDSCISVEDFRNFVINTVKDETE